MNRRYVTCICFVVHLFSSGDDSVTSILFHHLNKTESSPLAKRGTTKQHMHHQLFLFGEDTQVSSDWSMLRNCLLRILHFVFSKGRCKNHRIKIQNYNIGSNYTFCRLSLCKTLTWRHHRKTDNTSRTRTRWGGCCRWVRDHVAMLWVHWIRD